MDWLTWLFDTSKFKVPPACGGWSAFTTDVTIVSNFAIWLAFMAIPVSIYVLVAVLKLADGPIARMAFPFALYTFWCGITHLGRALSFYWPAYNLFAIVSIITAMVAWSVSLYLLPVIWKEVKVIRAKTPLERLQAALDAFQAESADVFTRAKPNE